MDNRKKMKLFLFLGIISSIMFLGVSFAYYYREVIIPNEFIAMTYNVTLEEEFNNDWGIKKVYIKNKEKTNTAVVLRVNYNEI